MALVRRADRSKPPVSYIASKSTEAAVMGRQATAFARRNWIPITVGTVAAAIVGLFFIDAGD